MPVNKTHPEYDLFHPKWNLTRNASTGLYGKTAKAFVQKRSGEDDIKHNARVEKAIYTNYTGRTREGLKGAIFRLSPVTAIPPDIEPMIWDCDGSGRSIEGLAKFAVDEVLETGRIGFLADYPQAPEGLTAAEVSAFDLRPTIAPYTAETIINWKSATIGGKNKLVLLVLKEMAPSSDDEFGHESVERYRVLRLQPEGYTQQMYGADGDPIAEPFLVKRADGSRFDHIPFYFAGARDNQPDVDDPVLYDIAKINIGHFRNSADHESNLSVHGGGTLVISTSMSPEQFAAANPAGVTIGENSGLILSEGGKAELLQLNAAQAIKEEMIHKEEMMLQLGAKIITRQGTQKTAEEARIQATSENSMLDTVVGNISEAITNCLYDCRQFVSVQEVDIEFELNRDFWENGLNPQEIMAMIQAHDLGVMPKVQIVRRLKDAGWIDGDETPEEILQSISEQSPI